MTEQRKAVEDRLAELRKAFRVDLRYRFSAIDQAWSSLNQDRQNSDALNDLILLAHKLAGSSGLFGFTELSGESRNLEVYLLDFEDLDRQVDDEQIQMFNNLISKMRACVPDLHPQS